MEPAEIRILEKGKTEEEGIAASRRRETLALTPHNEQ
jgi:hypothetical protein